MKKIKINFCGIPIHMSDEFIIEKILKERYEVEISDNPDYLFCGPLNRYEYCRFSGIRIFYGLECYYPDMNLFDYAMAFDKMGDNDRYQQSFLAFFNEKQLTGYDKCGKEELKNKEHFCNYIYSHAGMKERTEIFKIISKYKKVDSAGRWLNNMNGFTPGEVTNWDEKIAFQRKYKFSIAVENFSYPYYITEKILDAFRAKTIPIYYGDPKIGEYINEEAFINLHNYENFEEALEKIKELDNDDEKYFKMLSAPKFVEENFIEKQIEKMRKFLFNIFDQDYEKAFRRPRFLWPQKHELQLKLADYSVDRKKERIAMGEYFKNNDINKIAIYGQGEVYRYIKKELLDCGVDIKCVIETLKNEKSINEDGIPIFCVDDVDLYKDVEAIVITTSYVMDEIKICLEQRNVKNRIISIDDILDKQVKFNNRL